MKLEFNLWLRAIIVFSYVVLGSIFLPSRPASAGLVRSQSLYPFEVGDITYYQSGVLPENSSLSPSQNHTQTTNSSAAIYPSGKSWDFQGVGPVSGNREFVARQLVFDLRSLASCSESVIYPKIGFKYVVSQNSIPSGGNGTLAYAAFMPNNTPTSISTIDGSILNASLSES